MASFFSIKETKSKQNLESKENEYESIGLVDVAKPKIIKYLRNGLFDIRNDGKNDFNKPHDIPSSIILTTFDKSDNDVHPERSQKAKDSIMLTEYPINCSDSSQSSSPTQSSHIKCIDSITSKTIQLHKEFQFQVLSLDSNISTFMKIIGETKQLQGHLFEKESSECLDTANTNSFHESSNKTPFQKLRSFQKLRNDVKTWISIINQQLIASDKWLINTIACRLEDEHQHYQHLDIKERNRRMKSNKQGIIFRVFKKNTFFQNHSTGSIFYRNFIKISNYNQQIEGAFYRRLSESRDFYFTILKQVYCDLVEILEKNIEFIRIQYKKSKLMKRNSIRELN